MSLLKIKLKSGEIITAENKIKDLEDHASFRFTTILECYWDSDFEQDGTWVARSCRRNRSILTEDIIDVTEIN